MTEAESFIMTNKKKLDREETKKKLSKEEIEELKKAITKGECFEELLKLPVWDECCKVMKEDVYNSLSFNPADPKNDWWAKYAYGLKCFMERCKGYADRSKEAKKQLSK